MSRFSVLTPVYNVEAYLPACIQSVLAQTEPDWELVLIDDGSTDASGSIADTYAAKYPERIRAFHQSNQGLIAARRAGIAQARGEFCLFLDGDDELEPDALAAVGDTVEREKADMVIFCYADVFEGAERAIPADPVFGDGTVFRGRDKEALYGELMRGWKLNNLCTKAIRSAILQGDETDYAPYFGNPQTEDLLQTLYPVTEAETVVYRALPLYRYRRRPGSMSLFAMKGNIEKQFNEPVMALLRRYMSLWGMDGPEHLRAYHTRRLFNLISLFWQHYRAARTGKEKREVLAFDWGGHLTGEDRQYLQDNGLSRIKQIQLWSILHRHQLLLELFLLVGSGRMRARHGG